MMILHFTWLVQWLKQSSLVRAVSKLRDVRRTQAYIVTGFSLRAFLFS